MNRQRYFTHDYNSRSDEKIVRLRRALGWAGYGVYWAIVEKLHESGASLACDYGTTAYELMVDEETVKRVIEDFGLFYVKDGKFGSKSVDRRVQDTGARSEAARVGGLASWAARVERDLNNRSTVVDQPFNTTSTINKEINKERKKERTYRGASATPTPASPWFGFDSFWTAYPKRKDKIGAARAWNKLRPDAELQKKIMMVLEEHKKRPDWLKDGGQYVPHPKTWLNGRRWEDEVSTQPTTGDPTGKPTEYKTNAEFYAAHGIKLAE